MAKLKKISGPSEFVTLRIKKNTMDILKSTKHCYELAWSEENVTYDTILIRLLESGVKRLDPEVNKLRGIVQSMKEKARIEEKMAGQGEARLPEDGEGTFESFPEDENMAEENRKLNENVMEWIGGGPL